MRFKNFNYAIVSNIRVGTAAGWKELPLIGTGEIKAGREYAIKINEDHCSIVDVTPKKTWWKFWKRSST